MTARKRPLNGNGNGGRTHHTFEESYRVETENSHRLGRLETTVGDLGRSVSGLQTDTNYIRESISQLISHDNRPFNWGWLIAGVIGFASLLAGYAVLISEPIRNIAVDDRDRLDELQSMMFKKEREAGRDDERLDRLTRDVEGLISRSH